MIKITMPSDNMSLKESEALRAPRRGGIYYFFDRFGTIMYVGKSKDLNRRIREHQRNSHFYIYVHYIKLFFADSELEREMYETYAINKHKPRYNSAKVYEDPDNAEYVLELDAIDERMDEIEYLIKEARSRFWYSSGYFWTRETDSEHIRNVEESHYDSESYAWAELGEDLRATEDLRELRAEKIRLRGRRKTVESFIL